ncbi:MAG: hypothetical protein ABIP95_10605 [Pelobium sp.]
MMKISISFLLTILGLQSCKGQEQKALPEEFNQYSVLNTNFKSDNFEIVLLSEVLNYMPPHPIRLFYSVNKQVILEESRDDNQKEEGFHYFKLDENANVIDSLYVPYSGVEQVIFIGDYNIHKRNHEDSTYDTWPLNGDTTQKKMAVLNEDLSWPDEKTAKKEEEIVSKATYYFYDASYNTNTNNQRWTLQKLFYFMDGKWQILNRPFPKIIDIDEDLDYRRYRDNFFYSSDDGLPDAVPNFNLKHYQKEEKLTYLHSIGGGSQSSSVNGWVGTGYFDIPLLNDTLKVKKSNLIVEEATPADPVTRYYLSNGKRESVSPFNINVYTNPVLNFAIYSTSKFKVYAIRKKRK